MISQFKNITITIYENTIINHETILYQCFEKVRKYTSTKIKEIVGHYFHLAISTEFIIAFDMKRFYLFFNFYFISFFYLFLLFPFFFFFFFDLPETLKPFLYIDWAINSKLIFYTNIFLKSGTFEREEENIHSSKKIQLDSICL